MNTAVSQDTRLKPKWSIHKVGVWVPCGTGNLGNEMTMSAIIYNLRQLHPEIDLVGFSWNPEDTYQRYRIPSFLAKRTSRFTRDDQGPRTAAKASGRRDIKSLLRQYPKVYRAIRNAAVPALEIASLNKIRNRVKNLDLLIFAGTGTFTDSWGGALGFPYDLARWTTLCRLTGTKVAVVSAGAGPLDGSFSKWLVKSVLNDFVYLSFRDKQSRGIVSNLGKHSDIHVYPDLAFSLPVREPHGKDRRKNHKEVAIIGLPFRKPGWWENPDETVYRQYIDTTADFVVWLWQRGYKIRLVTTHPQTDAAFNHDLTTRIDQIAPKRPADALRVAPSDSFEEVMDQLAKVDVVIASRFHGAIFSYLAGKPVLGVSYHPKVNTLMEEFGQEGYCIDLYTIGLQDLMTKFVELEENIDQAKTVIQTSIRNYRQALNVQYEKILSL